MLSIFLAGPYVVVLLSSCCKPCDVTSQATISVGPDACLKVARGGLGKYPLSTRFIHIIFPQNISRYRFGELYLSNLPQNFSRHAPVTNKNLYIDPVCLYSPLANLACKGTPANPQSYSCPLKSFARILRRVSTANHSSGYMAGICLIIWLAFCIGQEPMPKLIPQTFFFDAPLVRYAQTNPPKPNFPACIGCVDDGRSDVT